MNLTITTQQSIKLKRKAQDKITNDVEQFLSSGGKIEQLDSGKDLMPRKANYVLHGVLK